MYFGFTPPDMQDPQLQRARQKMLTMEPQSKAILSTAAIDANFAGRDAMRQLKLAQISSDIQNRENAFNLHERNTNQQMNFDKDAFDFSKKQNMIGTLLSGAGLVPKIYMGSQVYGQSSKSAKDMMELAKTISESTNKIKIGGR